MSVLSRKIDNESSPNTVRDRNKKDSEIDNKSDWSELSPPRVLQRKILGEANDNVQKNLIISAQTIKSNFGMVNGSNHTVRVKAMSRKSTQTNSLDKRKSLLKRRTTKSTRSCFIPEKRGVNAKTQLASKSND